MRILVAGDRHWRCDELAERVVNRLIARHGSNLVIIHGGECGVDQAFSRVCQSRGIEVEAHVADWKGLGNISGPGRNKEMVESRPGLCIAFHQSIETSVRTKDCVRQALAAGIPVYLIDDDRGVPRSVVRGDPRLE